jgi:hypothetical protein
MFWSKRKVKGEKEAYLLEFRNYMNDEGKRQVYKEIDALYKEIKLYYSEKMKDYNFDIKIERIQLEKNLGKFEGPLSNFNMAILIGIITAVFPGYLETYGVFTAKGNIIVSSIAFLIFCVILTLQLKKPFKKDKIKEVTLSVCLIVLDELEAEVKDSELRTREQSERIANKQMLEQISDPRRVVKSIAMTALEEVAVGLVSKDSFIRKLFRRKKK